MKNYFFLFAISLMMLSAVDSAQAQCRKNYSGYWVETLKQCRQERGYVDSSDDRCARTIPMGVACCCVPDPRNNFMEPMQSLPNE